jgi:methionyl-tRNA formyltransferase
MRLLKERDKTIKITLVTDNPNSWIVPFVRKLKKILEKEHNVFWVFDHKKIETGDISFFLSCEKIIKPEILNLNKHNLIIHESKLPKGRGWAPLNWQILEGKNKIPITLFEAEKKIDSGDIYIQEYINFKGHELTDELREKQGEKTIEIILKFISLYPEIKCKKQKGRPTYYRRRFPKDSELNINKTIKEQFNLLRVVNNEKYPAFFNYRGKKYIIKIYKNNIKEIT